MKTFELGSIQYCKKCEYLGDQKDFVFPELDDAYHCPECHASGDQICVASEVFEPKEIERCCACGKVIRAHPDHRCISCMRSFADAMAVEWEEWEEEDFEKELDLF